MARKISYLHALGVGLALFAWSATAQAVHCGPEAGGLTCTDIGGTDVGGDCTLGATFPCTADTIINIPGNLTITAGNGIDCSGADGAPGAPGQPGDPGFDLSLNVGGDLNLAGFIVTDGGTGGSGTPGQPGGIGGAAGDIDIDVCGDVAVVAGAGVTATGGSGGPGGSGSSIAPNGGNGNVGGAGGSVDIDADGSLTQADGSVIDAGGGPGGAGGAGAINGNGGVGADAGVGGSVVIFSCATDIAGLVGAGGGTGGSGGSGAGTTGDGGINGNGADSGNVTLASGSDLLLQATAHVIASGGNEGAVGGGNPPAVDVASGGNGGTFTTNNCPVFDTIDSGALIETQGGSEDGLPGSTVPLETAPCCPCAIDIQKTVALDENCDGAADGAFSDSVTQEEGQCVVYRICVTNIGDTGAGPDDRPQEIDDVLVDDADIGIVDEDFGDDLAPGEEECQLVPAEAPATDCPGPSCVCEDVVGMNTAVVDNATCVVDGSDACDNTPPNPGPDSNCDDDANVACTALPCSVEIDKTVAPDDTCDGIPDGPFVDSVSQAPNECVIYRICVTNTGQQVLNATGVTVSDATLGILNLNFGTINPGPPAVCRDIPTQAPADDCPNGTCICENVEGTNTAVVSSAICEDTQDNACDSPASDCDDTATVDCVTQECPHFKCYRSRASTPFMQREVTLVDQFVSTTAAVRRPSRFCNPADKNGEGIPDPTAHLLCYDIDEPAFTQRDVLVSNQFGEQTLHVVEPVSLCNPAIKDMIPSNLNIDHFKCYRVRRTPGTVLNQTVTVTDQFETRTAEVVRPWLLCNPVDKNGEGIKFPTCHLTCYKVRPGAQEFTPRSVLVEDQFAEQDLDAFRGVCRRVEHLCVPSTKTELP